jgi:hypothetical protein
MLHVGTTVTGANFRPNLHLLFWVSSPAHSRSGFVEVIFVALALI